MQRSTGIQMTIYALFGLALFSILIKLYNGYFVQEVFEDGLRYEVKYEFDLHADQDESFYVKAFLPKENFRQRIYNSTTELSGGDFQESPHGINQMGLWNGVSDGQKSTFSYTFKTHVQPVEFSIDRELILEDVQDLGSADIHPTTFIESTHPDIVALAQDLQGDKEKVDEILSSFFNHVYKIPAQPIKELMTATEVLEKNAASCNGKSRLFVALCRSLDIPARVAGGLILNEERKKTSHLWAEVKLNDQWVPFDPLNGYYAYLPANYLEIYKGDEFLVKRSSHMLFDYNYDIKLIEERGAFLSEFNMFFISEQTGLSMKLLAMMILLPLGALIVAIFRNVIGMKTFGVFLPVLIAFSFEATGLLLGITLFVTVLVFISLIHFPLMKWGVLHVPKLVVMLSSVVFLFVVLLYVGVEINWAMSSALTFFPIVILTIASEKYARIVVEEGVKDATRILAQTVLVAVFCYFIVSSNTIFLLLMNFPELLLFIGVLSLMLGKWVGLRVSEYKRFNWVLS